MLIDIKMHKAISVIQFKVEGQIIKKNPGFKMEDSIDLHDLKASVLIQRYAAVIQQIIVINLNPIKCNGKVMVIDGGFSKAYQKETGIAGYTLISNSYGLILVEDITKNTLIFQKKQINSTLSNKTSIITYCFPNIFHDIGDALDGNDTNNDTDRETDKNR